MKPFLTIPFRTRNYKISGGWIYSAKETKISGLKKHDGIDYLLPRGEPILAASSGWALSSYHWHLLWDKVGKGRIRYRRYKGKLLGSGYGYFVAIYHPKEGLFTRYGHPEKISLRIPFILPLKRRLRYDVAISHFAQERFPEEGVWVKRGQVIGWCGDSGVTWAYRDYPRRPDPQKYPSWWLPHLHFEVYRYRDKEGRKPNDSYLDPYDIYKTARYYPRPAHKRPLGKNHLWLLGKDGLPK